MRSRCALLKALDGKCEAKSWKARAQKKRVPGLERQSDLTSGSKYRYSQGDPAPQQVELYKELVVQIADWQAVGEATRVLGGKLETGAKPLGPEKK